jgi:hypothetical protein
MLLRYRDKKVVDYLAVFRAWTAFCKKNTTIVPLHVPVREFCSFLKQRSECSKCGCRPCIFCLASPAYQVSTDPPSYDCGKTDFLIEFHVLCNTTGNVVNKLDCTMVDRLFSIGDLCFTTFRLGGASLKACEFCHQTSLYG